MYLVDRIKQILTSHNTPDVVITDVLSVLGSSNRKKLTPGEVRDIRSRYRRGETQASIADDFSINPATVSRIVRGDYH